MYSVPGPRPPALQPPPREELLQLTPTNCALVAFAAALGACAGEPSLRVQVCSDLAVPTELDAVRVVVLDAQRKSERFASVFELIECPAGRLRTLPQVLEIPSPKAAAWLRVEGLRDGIPVASAETRLLAGDGESEPVPVSLESTCRGLVCPLGQTCLVDACAPVPFHAEAPMRCVSTSSSGGADAESDTDFAPDSGSTPDSDFAPDSESDPDPDAELAPAPDTTSLCTPPNLFLQGGASP